MSPPDRRLGSLVVVLALALPAVGAAQGVSIDLGNAGAPGATARLVQLTALIGLLSLAPSLLVMATAFARIAIVLSLLRSAIGAQGIPPNPVLIGLALFLTLFVMQPVLDRSWADGLQPMMDGRIGEIAGLQAAAEPFRGFMAEKVREGTSRSFWTSPICRRWKGRHRPGGHWCRPSWSASCAAPSRSASWSSCPS